MGTLLIRGGKIITMSKLGVISDGAVLVEGKIIKDIGNWPEISNKYRADVELGGADHIVMPGFINCHHHCSARAFRYGIVDAPLELWKLQIFGSNYSRHSEDFLYWSTLYSLIEQVKAGATCITNHFYASDKSPYMGSQKAIQAFNDIGVKACFVLATADQNLFALGQEELESELPPNLAEKIRSLDFSKRYLPKNRYFELWENVYKDFHSGDGLVKIFFGPDGAQWCSLDLLMDIKKRAEKFQTNIHMHLMETKYQMLYGLKKYGKTYVRLLDEAGFWGEEVSCAHSVWLTGDDIERLSKNGATVVHNPSSNLRLSSGVARVKDMLDAGLNVALGTDNQGFSDDNDIISDLRLCALLQRTPGVGGKELTSNQALALVSLNGAKGMGMLRETGCLEVGKRADIITLDTSRIAFPYVNPALPPEDLLLQRASACDVKNTIVDGRILMKEGLIQNFSQQEVAAHLIEEVEKTWRAPSPYAEIIKELEPYLKRYYEKFEAMALKNHYQYNTI